MKISVALCTFNGEKFLKEQLDSILQQTISVDEIVVCDDVSTDSSLLILKNYEKEFPAIFKIYQNEENLGYVRNFEKAMSLCTGEIIFLTDQDDVWKKNKAEKIIDYFTQNPQKKIVAHDLNLIGFGEKKQTFWELNGFGEKEKNLNSEELLQHILFNGNVIPGMSLAIKKETLQQYFPLLKVDSIIIHDYELIIKSLRDNNFGVLNEVLGDYRKHESQSIGYKEKKDIAENNLSKIQQLSEQYLRIKKYSQDFNFDKNITKNFQQEIQKKYSLFLKQFPLWKRLLIHWKSKYYYKIIHF